MSHLPADAHRRLFASIDQEAVMEGFSCRDEAQVEKPAQAHPLADPKLQQLFGDAIEGALAFGFQGANRPPAGHWLDRFWRIGRAEATAMAFPKSVMTTDGLDDVPIETSEREARG